MAEGSNPSGPTLANYYYLNDSTLFFLSVGRTFLKTKDLTPSSSWPRTLAFHAGDTGSNPVGVALNSLVKLTA